jgi:hypothetical protein
MGQNGKPILGESARRRWDSKARKIRADVRKSIERMEVACYKQFFLLTIMPFGGVRSHPISRDGPASRAAALNDPLLLLTEGAQCG